MEFENFFNPQLLQRNPRYAAPTGALLVLIGFFTAFLLFPHNLSLTIVFFSSLFLLPYVIKIYEYGELELEEDLSRDELEHYIYDCFKRGYTNMQVKQALLKAARKGDLAVVDQIHADHLASTNVYQRHKHLIIFYLYLFIGMVFAYLFISLISPPSFQRVVFAEQQNILNLVIEGNFNKMDLFTEILTNNLTVAFICVILSFLAGTGAVFILNFNASLAALFFGNFISSVRFILTHVNLRPQYIIWGPGLKAFLAPLTFVPHTIVELTGFLLAAIAGGILAKSFFFQEHRQMLLLRDSLTILGLAALFILVAAYMEVTIPFLL